MCYNLHSKSYQEYIIPVRTIVLKTEKNRNETSEAIVEIMAESL